MNVSQKKRRSNQELRTRKGLLEAASQLMRQGKRPTMEEVAEEALVSRATAYRYFRNVEALLVEAPVDAMVGDPARVFDGDTTTDPEDRMEKAEAFMHETVFRNEAQLRLMISNSIGRDLEDDAMPARQNRRVPLIEMALAPSRQLFADKEYENLCAALSLILGPESMIVFKDVLRTDEQTARSVKQWAVRALVRAARQQNG
jgi:AcrR family transcriptional regulator